MPKPEHIIWRTPGFPADGENDYFFSGHVGPPCIAGMALWDRGQYTASLAMHFLNLLQIIFMVTLQLHYTVDLVTGIFSGIACYYMMCGLVGEVVKSSLACFHILIKSLLGLAGEGAFDFSASARGGMRAPMMTEERAYNVAMVGILVGGAITSLLGGF